MKAYLPFSSSSPFYCPSHPSSISLLRRNSTISCQPPPPTCLIPFECILYQSARLMILEPNQTTSFCCLASKFSNCFNSLLWSSITRFYCHFLFPPNSPLTPPPFLPFVMKRSHFSASCWPSFFNIQALSLGQFQRCSASTKVTSFLFLRFQLKQTVFNGNFCELMGDLLALVKMVQFPLPCIGLPINLS